MPKQSGISSGLAIWPTIRPTELPVAYDRQDSPPRTPPHIVASASLRGKGEQSSDRLSWICIDKA